MLNDVHRGHRQAGAVDQTSDVAVQLYVIQIIFARFDFQRGLFGEVSHGLNIEMTIERVVVQADFRVHGLEGLLAIGLLDHAERIDLDHRSVAFPPGLIDPQQKL